jgi:FixJ family two-component response regulator
MGWRVPRERLLAVIDDDESFRSALAELLRSLGHEARAFASTEEFVAANDVGYDCIITDVQMPGMSGIDLKHLLNAYGSRVPVIMVTGRAEPGLEGRVASCGAACLLKKPFEATALIDWLEKIMA